MKVKLTLIASALLLMSNIAGAQEQTAPTGTQEQAAPTAKMTGQEKMGHMGQDMMGRGMMHPGKMRQSHAHAMMILMDTDSDGALFLEEVQTAHAKIFKAIDTDKDGKVTMLEIETFFRGLSPTSDQ